MTDKYILKIKDNIAKNNLKIVKKINLPRVI